MSRSDSKKERIGEESINKYGTKMIIIEYENNFNMTVQFEDGSTRKTQYNAFKNGQIRSYFDKTIYGVGFFGSDIKAKDGKGKSLHKYRVWESMLQRCYSKSKQEKSPTYIGCSVCEEWHNFTNFAKWYDENYYEISGEKMCLDKDILVKGNKIYSPETCVFVPEKINNLLTARNSKRGKYPIGVTYHKGSKKYIAACSINGKQKQFGGFNSPKDAFDKYKELKEEEIKSVANKYKSIIPSKLYNALVNIKINIED